MEVDIKKLKSTLRRFNGTMRDAALFNDMSRFLAMGPNPIPMGMSFAEFQKSVRELRPKRIARKPVSR